MKKELPIWILTVLIAFGLWGLSSCKNKTRIQPQKPSIPVTLYTESGDSLVFPSQKTADKFQELNNLKLSERYKCLHCGEMKQMIRAEIDSIMAEYGIIQCDDIPHLPLIERVSKGQGYLFRIKEPEQEDRIIYVGEVHHLDSAIIKTAKEPCDNVEMYESGVGVFVTDEGSFYHAKSSEDADFYQRKLKGQFYKLEP